jgi:RND family efflux transporter MFP subunit
MDSRSLVGAVCVLAAAGVLAQGRAVRITTTQAVRADVEDVEWAVGLIETRTSSQVAAEVPGEIVGVFVDEGQGVAAGTVLAEVDNSEYQLELKREQAEVRRLNALLRQQERELERAKKLYQENLIAEDELDSIDAELDALRQQLAGAQAQANSTDRRLTKTRLIAPVDSEVATRNIDVGDYVQTGTVVFDLIDMRNLRVRLPFPEYRAPQLAVGLPVRLTSAAAGDSVVNAVVTEIRPSVNPSSRSLTVIVDFDNPGGWRPGASARADLILSVRKNALLVPQVAVVRRPAGDVVYAIEGGVAREKIIERGQRQDRMVEVLAGLTGDELIAADGAGFLADGAAVDIAGD